MDEFRKEGKVADTVLPYLNSTNNLTMCRSKHESELTQSEADEDDSSQDEKFKWAMSMLDEHTRNKINKAIEENKQLLNKKTKRPEKSSKSSKVTEFLLPEVNTEDLRIFKQSFKEARKDRKMIFDDNLSFALYDPKKFMYVQTLKGKNLEIYREFKSRTNKQKYGPLELVKDQILGWKVVATKPISKHTLITEYSGVVQENTEQIKHSDSIMEYMHSDSTDLVINPEVRGNLGRFLSGVNSKKVKKFKKNSTTKNGKSKLVDEPVNLPNCQSQKFNIDGGLHVLIYTSKDISAGETLFYDYNAGGLDEINDEDYL
jgi:hypothetical protein